MQAVLSRKKISTSFTLMHERLKKRLVFSNQPLCFKRGLIFVDEESVPVNLDAGALSSFHFLDRLPLPVIVEDGGAYYLCQ